MKRIFLCVFVFVLLLSGCHNTSQAAVCDHQWKPADCLTPKTCSVCWQTDGVPANHNWSQADCQTPKTCRNCEKTEGEPAEHQWSEATCTTPRTCQSCGMTEGVPIPHSMGQWTVQEDHMNRSCRNCPESEQVPYDQIRFLTDNHIGTWKHLETERIYSGYMTHVLFEHSDYTVSLEEDGTFSAYLGENISGVWTRKQVPDTDPQSTCCYALKYSDDDHTKYLDLVIEGNVARISDHSTQVIQIFYFYRDCDWNHHEENALLTGYWNSLLVDILAPSKTRPEQQIITDHSITFHEDGTLEANFNGKKAGKWVFIKHFHSPGEFTEDLYYVLQFEGDAEGYAVTLKNNGSLAISETINRHTYNNWFAKVSAEEATFFADTKEHISGTWQAVAAYLEHPETGTLTLETDPSGYRLIFLEDGTMTVSGSAEQHTWEHYLYAFDATEGSQIHLNCNGMYYSCRLKLDGQLDVLIELDGRLVYLLLEKE